jgi:hypothetical protein
MLNTNGLSRDLAQSKFLVRHDVTFYFTTGLGALKTTRLWSLPPDRDALTRHQHTTTIGEEETAAMATSDPTSPKQSTPPQQPVETRIESPGEVVVEHHEVPPKGPVDKQIHHRRPLPPIPDKTSKDEET